MVPRVSTVCRTIHLNNGNEAWFKSESWIYKTEWWYVHLWSGLVYFFKAQINWHYLKYEGFKIFFNFKGIFEIFFFYFLIVNNSIYKTEHIIYLNMNSFPKSFPSGSINPSKPLPVLCFPEFIFLWFRMALAKRQKGD